MEPLIRWNRQVHRFRSDALQSDYLSVLIVR
jgi:hypothetical protein